MSFAAVAWDVDGTLLDSEPRHHRALLRASREWGADLSHLSDQAFRGVDMMQVWDMLQGTYPDHLGRPEWLDAIRRYYLADRDGMAATPDAVATIRALARRGIPQVCVSNSERAIVEANLEALGVADCLLGSISLDDVPAGKPDPYPYAEACRMLGLPASRVVAVEDSPSGVRSARAAGLFVLGYAPSGPRLQGTDRDIGEIGEVLRLFFD